MGSDALYRWGYVLGQSLVVSDWRSIDKEQAEVILKDVYPDTPFKVMQGRDKALDNYFGLFKTPTWESSLKDHSVWSDGKWVIKVGSLDEQNAMKSLLGVPGIVQLGGSFLVTVGEHKGSTLLFTPYTGEPVDDIDSDPYVRVVAREAVGDALGAMHRKGWHHHDVHSGNVLKDNEQRITLIDFGHAVRAHDCLDPETCPDGEYLPDGDEELAEESKMRYVVEELETEYVKEETELTDSRDIQ
ncbi:hypothetical protein C0992_008772 [Termitomyces sp. T32_za158]|nr:hypothetical protein C0992_008772 [Termitomyces sp. T32_za158]